MKVERIRPAVLQLTLHAYEAAALMAAVRWVVDGSEGELPDEAVDDLRRLLADYDSGVAATDE